MSEPIFEWDPNKDSANRRKHGVSFREASTAFRDEDGLLIYDREHSVAEDRFILLGLSASLRLLVVCHCYRERANALRIISARKATKNERKQYEASR